jgi:2-polyprenyl-6-methoxyphenol hydroxylase-like FAD-dependent oxidoreductase
MRIIINGTGIAGPTLAYWLRHAGHDVLLVEAAPHLRTGGYVIDFGLVGYDIAEKMGLIPRLQERGYRVKELRYVDRHGRTSASAPVDALARLTNGRYVTVQRSDLAAAIYDALGGAVETMFGDSVASIEKSGDGVRVGFDHAPARDADLLIGADGLHSRVRELMFGSAAGIEVSLGYEVAAFEVRGYRPRDELVYLGYGVPGRQV